MRLHPGLLVLALVALGSACGRTPVLDDACLDGVQDDGESDVDCGGRCVGCAAGGRCRVDPDCRSMRCRDGICAEATAADSCQDGRRDGDESDVDCGGSCPGCANGRRCEFGRDCQSRLCLAGVCTAVSCSDGVQDGSETDIDCGGSCPPCAQDQRCAQGGDCQSGVCDAASHRCRAPSCADGVQNGDETGRDCGGSCGPCGDGQGCRLASDCRSLVCTGRQCQPATCSDKVKNGSETDIDCGGGLCRPCFAGQACLEDRDCDTADCWKKLCSNPPTLASVRPPIGPLGGGTAIAINGDHFAAGATVQIGGAPAGGVKFQTPVQLLAVTPPGKAAGRVTVTVTNPDGQSGSADLFTFSPRPPPFASVRPAGAARQLVAALVADDLDGDGLIDLAATDQIGNAVLLLIGRGDGTFRDAVALPVGGQGPDALVSGDFDGDGHRDLAVANFSSADVSVLLGQGGGAFARSVEYQSGGGSAAAVVSGDFDGDGHLDLCTADYSDSFVRLLRGDGKGGFRAATSTAAGQNPEKLAAGDFNGDGHLDLVAANATGARLTYLFGRGDGSFPSVVAVPTGARSRGVAAGDFDRDGKPDVAAVADYTGIEVFLSSKMGGQTVRTPEVPTAVAVGDLDGDGRLDLVSANSPGNLSVSLASGPGAFGLARTFAAFPAFSLAIADFNRDGAPDVAGATGHDVAVILGAGAGELAMPIDAWVPYDTDDRALVADLDGDGRLDVACSDGPYLVYGMGDGTFEPWRPLPLNGGGSTMVLGDWNGDQRLDFALGGALDRAVTVVLATAARMYAAAPPSPTGYLGVTGLGRADWDGDGKLDLAFLGGGGVWGPMKGSGDGAFAPPHAPFVQMAHGPDWIEAGDLNGDGRPDMAVVARDGTLQIALVGNNGKFGAAQGTFVCGQQALAFRLGDIDGDGVLDAVVSCSERTLVVALGGGNGLFDVLPPVALREPPGPLALADFDGDGRLDVALAFSSLGAGLLRGTGKGRLAPPIALGPARPTIDIGAGDFNGDHKPDVMLHGEGTVTVLLNGY